MAKFKSIARIRGLPLGHDIKSPLMKSIISRIGGNPSVSYVFNFMEDGEFIERKVGSFYIHEDDIPGVGKRALFDTFTRNGIMVPVILQYKDGTKEYALKEVFKRNVYKKPKLVSAYIRDGIWNEARKKWLNPNSIYGNVYPVPEIARKMPFWNEEVERAIRDKDYFDIESRTGCSKSMLNTLNFWMMTGGKTSGCIEYSTENANQLERIIVKRPRFAVPPEDYSAWNEYPPMFFTMMRKSYLKSFYRDVVEEKACTRLYHTADLLNIVVPMSNGAGDSEDEEVWNSLDVAVSSGIYK